MNALQHAAAHQQQLEALRQHGHMAGLDDLELEARLARDTAWHEARPTLPTRPPDTP